VANTAIFYDRSLSLDDYLQAQDRIHRISQQRECVIYNLIADGTVDDWVNELLAAKQLAASLALGDMSSAEYQTRATYEFVEALKRVLGDQLRD
jgi:SNF2 family DNA or RNA helicase